MGKHAYCEGMRQRIRDLTFEVNGIRARIEDSADVPLRLRLIGELEELEYRRDEMRERLRAIEREPEGAWEDLKAQFEEEWDALVQDFEERVGRLG